MTRVFRIVAAVLVSGALAACGSDGAPEPATAPPPASDPAPEVPSSGTPSSSAPASWAPASTAPASSTAGRGGYANPDEAIAGHLSAVPGVRYLGLCKNAKRDPAAVCALRMGFVGQDEVYGLGAPHSDVVGFLLLRKGPDGWRVVDDYAHDDGKATPPAWMAGVA
ncbi:hypothetical protein ACLQ22_26530 [Micromonospora sp. DT178]|uniref:hypothetical protein n=1 Tax=Micromonospora sp. DT178 TaxID=3393436 RepID=UPI003CFA01C5